jgi:hypothetical protein
MVWFKYMQKWRKKQGTKKHFHRFDLIFFGVAGKQANGRDQWSSNQPVATLCRHMLMPLYLLSGTVARTLCKRRPKYIIQDS